MFKVVRVMSGRLEGAREGTAGGDQMQEGGRDEGLDYLGETHATNGWVTLSQHTHKKPHT